MTTAAAYGAWLHGTLSVAPSGRYRHQRLNEEPLQRDEAVRGLMLLVRNAHADVHRHLLHIAGRPSLDPLGDRTFRTPLPDYPAGLPLNALKGYTGEFMAGFIAENFAPHGVTTWEVPAYLFRWHTSAFEYLERRRQARLPEKQVPGRTGDDCLAFERDTVSGRIVKALACEAKCTAKHDTAMIKDAHVKASEPIPLPVNIAQVIAVLLEREETEQIVSWIVALRELLYDQPDPQYERYDLVSYVCGQPPVFKDAWLPTSAPHPAYTGGRRLEAVEIHLNDVDGFVRAIYGQAGVTP